MTIPDRPAWVRASRCDSASCVEAAYADGEVWVRDSKDPAGPRLRFSPGEWAAFTDAVAAGEFGLGRLAGGAP